MMTFVGLVACGSDDPEGGEEASLSKTTWVAQDAQRALIICFDNDKQGSMRVVPSIEAEEEAPDSTSMEVYFKFDYTMSGTKVHALCRLTRSLPKVF